mgnify:CR=1 FL=1
MKKSLIFTALFLCFVMLFCSITPVIAKSENISQKVFRLHILANSDSEDDQQLKLKVRDKVMATSGQWFADCCSVESAVRAASEHLDEINEIVQSVIHENGYHYDSTVYTAKEFFNVREYGDFSLPSGVYNSLKIEIGEGKGKNWWCVLFPSVCLSGCTEDLEETLTDEEMQMITSDKYIIRFKALEIIERIKYAHKKED